MTTPKYLIGLKFHNLTFKEKTEEQNKAGSFLYLLDCDCGELVKATSTQVTIRGLSGCSVCHKVNKQSKRDEKHSLVGETFERLTVLERAGKDKHGYSMYLCECSCEAKTIKEIRGIQLSSGSSRSCGCLFDEYNKSDLKKQYARKQMLDQLSDPEKRQKLLEGLRKANKRPEVRAKRSESAKNKAPIKQETREKLRKAMLGRDAWWLKGQKWNTGRKVSEETKEKLRVANLGKKASQETKDKLSRIRKEKPVIPSKEESLKFKERMSKLGAYEKGESNRRFNPNKCDILAKFRGCQENKDWRYAVLARDGFTCQLCGQVGGRLEADHIRGLAQLKHDLKITTLEELRTSSDVLDIRNGRTLCVDCHKGTPNYKGKGKVKGK